MSEESFPIPEKRNLVLLLGAATFSGAMLWGASHASGPVGLVLCALLFSLSANTLFSLLHEAVHGSFSPQPWINDWAGRFAAAWFPTGLSIQRVFHLTHHRNNRSPAEQFDLLHDGDVTWLKKAQWYAILTGLYWLIAVCGVVAYLLLPKTLVVRSRPGEESKLGEQTGSTIYLAALDRLDPVKSRLEILLALLFQATLAIVLDLSLFGWLACYAAFALSWSSLQYADHAFSPLDRHEGAWNLKVGRLTHAIYLNYHYHLAHHRDPGIPWVHLPGRTRPGDPHPSFWRVWRMMWGGPRAAEEFALKELSLTSSTPSPRFVSRDGYEAWSRLTLTVAFGLIFLVSYGGASKLSPLVPWHIEIGFAFEKAIPFIPAAAVAYLSVIPLLLAAPFLLRSVRELWPLFAVLVTETLIGAFFFLALPAQATFGDRHADGLAGVLFHLADTLNLEGNKLPSLHVALALSAGLAYAPKFGKLGRALLSLWVWAIIASTLLLHEHHLVAVVAGLLLASLCVHFVGNWARRPEVVRAADTELLCLYNFFLFGRRHPRYWLIALALYKASFPRWRARRVLRTGFCFLQAVDDLLDGDRASDREPLERVEELIASIESRKFGENNLQRLARSFTADLLTAGGLGALEQAVALLRVMQKDRARVLAGAWWSADALSEHHRATFSHSVDLLMIAAGATLRATDVPELIDAFAWCSTARDLREDLAAGLVNIPSEVMEEAGIERAHLPDSSGRRGESLDLDRLIEKPAVRRWLGVERERARRLLDQADERLASFDRRAGASVLSLFSRSMRRFERRRFARLYPGEIE